MNEKVQLRAAAPADVPRIAELLRLAAAGLLEHLTPYFAAPGTDPLEVWEHVLAAPEGALSYRNTTMADCDGEAAGALLALPLWHQDAQGHSVADQLGRSELLQAGVPGDVIAPFLELPAADTFYIYALAVLDGYRARGIGSRLIEHARQQAKAVARTRLSLVALEGNETAVRLYRRLGFRVIDRRPRPAGVALWHPGDVVLMVVDI